MSKFFASATGEKHTSRGEADPVPFTQSVSIDGGWIGHGYTVPGGGAGYFQVSAYFTKDHADGGTSDDVFLEIRKVSDGNYAILARSWSGSDSKRETSSASVIVRMSVGDRFEFWASSDGGRDRTLSRYGVTVVQVQGA